MFVHPFRTASALVAALLAALLVITGLPGAASAATGRSLSIGASATAVAPKGSITFSGKLTRSPKGSAVVIQRKSGKSWVKAKAVKTTSAGGAYSAKITVSGTRGTYAYRAFAAKKGSLKAATSRTISIAVLTKAFASLTATPTTVTAGTSTTLAGAVYPFVKNTVVSVQHWNGSGWTTQTTAKLAANGTYSKAVALSVTTTYRVSVPRAGSNAPATTPSKIVVAKPSISTLTLPNGTRFAPYTAHLTTVGSMVGTWTAAPLPAGLSINATTGVISGTPTTTGDSNVVVGFTQKGTGLKAASKTYTLRVNQTSAPVISTTSLPAGQVTAAYSTTLTATGNPAGTWTATPLPAGLSLNSTTGVISGTPTATGNTNVVVGFTETGTGLAAAQKTFTLQVNQAGAPVISTTSLPTGQVGSSYTTTLTATGSPAGTWTAAPLPAGLSLDAGTGVISGTPTATGDTNVVIGFTQTDTGVSADPKTLTLRIGNSDAPVIATSSLPDGTRLTAGYSATLTAVGGPAGTWTASPLPAGLSLNASTGVISGTPTATGDTNVLVGFTQTSTGLAATPKTIPLHIAEAAAPVIATSSLPDGTRLTAGYSATLTATGNPAGTWTASPLPAGLSLNASTGVISGTPTATGDTNVVIGFTQTSTGLAATPKTLQLTVNEAAAPVISTSGLPDGTRAVGYTTTLTATGNPAGTWTASPLPAGLTLDPSTGVISGTPTAAGATNVVIGFTQTSTGLAATPKTLQLTIAEAARPVIATTALPAGTRFHAYSTQLAVIGNPAGTWSTSALPSGLSLDPSTGVISGIPNTAGDTNVTLDFTQTSTGLEAASVVVALHINQSKPIVATTSLPQGKAGQQYSFQLTTVGTVVGKWTVQGLPLGYSASATTGVISGNAPLPSTVNVKIKFTETSTGLVSDQVTLQLKVVINGG
ncbi:MAG: Ig family protein [Marmoricola sp.]|nr:Ig family protein [Marmoricola sp.]